MPHGPYKLLTNVQKGDHNNVNGYCREENIRKYGKNERNSEKKSEMTSKINDACPPS